MYIKKFHFSPFEVNGDVVSICAGEWVIKDYKIYKKDQLISPEEFYDEFVQYGQNRWFTEPFIRAFEDKKGVIPYAMAPFAVYCYVVFNIFHLKSGVKA